MPYSVLREIIPPKSKKAFLWWVASAVSQSQIYSKTRQILSRPWAQGLVTLLSPGACCQWWSSQEVRLYSLFPGCSHQIELFPHKSLLCPSLQTRRGFVCGYSIGSETATIHGLIWVTLWGCLAIKGFTLKDSIQWSYSVGMPGAGPRAGL